MTVPTTHLDDLESIEHTSAESPGTAVGPARGDAAPLAHRRVEAGSATDLLFAAVEKGTSVAELKELVGLHQQMAKLEALRQYSEAMAAFQAECPPIKRKSTGKITSNRTGSSFSFKYAEIDEIARTINPICAKHGLSYTWDAKVDKGFITVTCTTRHVAGHAETVSLTLPTETAAGMSEQQKVVAALSFGRRQTVSMAFGITTADDTPETNEANPERLHEDAVSELEDLLRESGANKERFLSHMGAKSIADIRAVDYQKAKSALEQVLAKRNRANASPTPGGPRR